MASKYLFDSPGYKLETSFASYLIWFFFEKTWKTAFDQLFEKENVYYKLIILRKNYLFNSIFKSMLDFKKVEKLSLLICF